MTHFISIGQNFHKLVNQKSPGVLIDTFINKVTLTNQQLNDLGTFEFIPAITAIIWILLSSLKCTKWRGWVEMGWTAIIMGVAGVMWAILPWSTPTMVGMVGWAGMDRYDLPRVIVRVAMPGILWIQALLIAIFILWLTDVMVMKPQTVWIANLCFCLQIDTFTLISAVIVKTRHGISLDVIKSLIRDKELQVIVVSFK